MVAIVFEPIFQNPDLVQRSLPLARQDRSGLEAEYLGWFRNRISG